MNGKEIKAVFFDLGNVLIRFDVDILANALGTHSRLKKPDFQGYVMDSPDMNRYMEGKITSSQFYNRTKRFFKMKIAYADFYRAWNSIFCPYPEMEGIVRGIKEKYPEVKLVLVSNTNETHFSFLEKEYDVLGVFDEKILSHEAGCQKPDAAIFVKALDAAGTIPRNTFYTDDRLDLIEAARTMGIRAYHFISHEKLREDLAKVNIFV
jgi:glucose-1-phosphatase